MSIDPGRSLPPKIVPGVMGSDQTEQLLLALRRTTRELVVERGLDDLDETLSRIVRAAVDMVPGVDAGGVSITEGGQITYRSPSSDDVGRLDKIQADLGEGPCVTAVEHPPADGIVLAHDLVGADAQRWPRFAPEAVALGFRSLMSVQLSTDGGVRAALNLYAHAAEVFDDSARILAGLFGGQAALLLYGSNRAANLTQALATRDLIGQAKGVLMERFTLTDSAAFDLMVRSSQDTNVKLIDVARWVTSNAGDDDPLPIEVERGR